MVRPASIGPFDREDHALARLVCPHIEKAIEGHADVSEGRIGKVDTIPPHPLEYREMTVAMGPDKHDDRVGEFDELVTVDAETLRIMSATLCE